MAVRALYHLLVLAPDVMALQVVLQVVLMAVRALYHLLVLAPDVA
jgi:hypothetical protein